jgi:hypothetical protein
MLSNLRSETVKGGISVTSNLLVQLNLATPSDMIIVRFSSDIGLFRGSITEEFLAVDLQCDIWPI